MPDSMLDRVLEIVKKTGPVLPVEVASKLGLDSFLANAYLSQLVDSGKIQISKERIGGSHLFLISGQENLASARVKLLVEGPQKTARMFAKDVPDNPNVREKQHAFAERLREIEDKDAKRQTRRFEPPSTMAPGHKVMPIMIKKVSQDVGDSPSVAVGGQMMPKPAAPKPEVTLESFGDIKYEEPQVTLEQPAAAEPDPQKSIAREVIEKTFKQKVEKLVEPSKLVDAALAMLVDSGAEIISKELKKKGKEADIIIDLPTKIGNLKMLATVRDKKSITEADLSMAYTEGAHRKLPIIFMTNGKLTKTAQNYHQIIAGLLKLKVIELN